VLVRLQPKEWMMYSVYLVFDEDNPDLEDESIREYVNTHNLIPKMQGQAMFDQQKREVMYFGKCYLGSHLEAIQDLQKELCGIDR